VSGAELGGQLQQRGYAVTAVVDDDDTGGTLYAGRWLNPYAAIEIGISHLGKYTARIDGKTRDREGLEHELIERFPTGGNALSLLLRYDIPVFAQLYVTPRVGGYVLATETKIEYDGGARYKDTDYGVGAEIDLGLTYRLSPGFSLGLGTGLLVPSSKGSIQQSYAQIEIAF